MNVACEQQTEVSLSTHELRRASGSIPLTAVSETPSALLEGLDPSDPYGIPSLGDSLISFT